MTPVKLALVGGSSTGKTTLFNELEKVYRGDQQIAFVHESARQYLNDNPTDNPFVFSVQEKILDLAMLKEKLASENNPKIIITDTSALEVMFYTKVRGDNEGAEHFLKRLEGYIPTYSKFLVMGNNEVPFENDAVRREDKDTRDEIHSMLINFYKERDLPYITINGRISERKERVMEIISSYLKDAN